MTSMGIYQHHRRHVPRFVWVWLVGITVLFTFAAVIGAAVKLAPAADATPPHPRITICHNGHELTVADDGYWHGHIHHLGDTLGACPTPEPTEEPTWTPSPEPSSSVTTPVTPPEPEPSTTPTTQPTLSPEPSASPTVAPSPSTSPASPAPSTTPATNSPVPSATSSASLVPLPVLPLSEASSVPYVAPEVLAATGMSEEARAGWGLGAALVVTGAVLVLARRRSQP